MTLRMLQVFYFIIYEVMKQYFHKKILNIPPDCNSIRTAIGVKFFKKLPPYTLQREVTLQL